ncbi:hypothetical protein BDR04DRAFT_791799 [Suillus decipiens]|nr:hypothetical protein BDR04DRAFT_791799 [Suillus decipiens]
MTHNPTFATLRALHALMGDALDDLHRIFSTSSTPHSSQCSSPAFPDSPEPVSVPPTPMSSTFSTQASSYGTPLSPLSNLQHDYPSPSLPYISSSPAEKLAACPAASAAATRIIAAAGQITSIVQKPFLFMSDASMVYTLPACLRLIEHLHIVEILRDAEDERQRLLSELRIIVELKSQSESDQSALGNGSDELNRNSVKGLASCPSFTRDAPTKAEEKALQLEGVCVKDISLIIKERTRGLCCVDSVRLAHPLRLLSTHHILRETAPDTFALTRVASLLDSGKSVADVFANPEKKYEDTSGIAAFVGLCTDELFKSAAYLTEAFTGVQLSSDPPRSGPTTPAGCEAHISALSTHNTVDDAHTSVFPANKAHICSPLAQPQPLRAQSFTGVRSEHPTTTSSTQTHRHLVEAATAIHALSTVAEPAMSPRLWDATMPAPIAGPPLNLGSGLLSPKRDTTPCTEASSIRTTFKLPPPAPHPSPLQSTIYSKSDDQNTPSALLVKCASVVSTLTLASTNSAVVSEGRTPSGNVGLITESGRNAGWRLDSEHLPAFNLAFNTPAPFFEWLEDGGLDTLGGNGAGAGCLPAGAVGNIVSTGAETRTEHVRNSSTLSTQSGSEPSKSFRLERFSQAMIGTSGWESPGAILTGFDWLSLPRGSTIVDVGGGIGSTTMILARAFGSNPGHRKSVSSEEAEDTVEDNSVIPQRSRNESTPRKSRWDLKSFASRGDLKSHTSRADLTSTNLKSARSHADLRLQSSQDEFSARQSTVPSCDDQDMQFRFIIQDRPVVVGLGLDAWRVQCPEMLESGQVTFYDHDFFLPQPPLPSSNLNRHPAVYILRVVLHDWPDARARHVLLNLRLASSPETKLIIADHVLPLACVDDGVRSAKREHQKSQGNKWTLDSVLAHLEGAHGTLAPAPLLPNLGKASATPFSMDIVMHITFNGKERTLRELCALALSSGWRIARVTYSKGSHFGHLVCEPVDIPEDAFSILPARPISDPAIDLSFECAEPSEDEEHEGPQTAQEIYANKLPSSLGPRPISTTILPLLPSPILERSSSRCGTPTFGSRVVLPRPDEIPSGKSKSYSLGRRWLKARGLGVRGVVEKQKRREESAKKADEHDDQSGQYGSPQHSRVWWKKAPLASPVAEERVSDTSIPRSPLRPRRGTITTPELSPPLPSQSPRIPIQYKFPAHRTTPSMQSNFQSDGSPSAPRSRRPSIASLTHKLNFSPFAWRPSMVDGAAQRSSDASASPQSTTFDTAYVQSADQEKKLRHRPSSPMMQKYHPGDDRQRGIRHHPSAPHLKGRSTRAEEPPPLPTTPKTIRDDGSSSAPRKSSLLSSPIFNASKSSLSTTTSRQRSRSILSSTPALIRAPSTPADPTSPKSKRQPSIPKLPRRLSIPMLRRKRGQSLTTERDP